MKLKVLLYFFIPLIFFAFGFYLSVSINRLSVPPAPSKETAEEQFGKLQKKELEFPTLKLPMRYFDYKYITSYSSCEGQNPKDPNCYKDASAGQFNGPYAYQSYPSTLITIEGYKNYDKQKPLTLDQVLRKAEKKSKEPEWAGDDFTFLSEEYIRKSFREMGPVIGLFMPDGDPQYINRADVTGDGVDELIVLTCPSMYAGSSCGTIWVADSNGNLLFSDTDPAIDLEPSEDTNGFYLYNVHPDDTEAFCCERMKYRVRFVYEDKKFIPVFQQVIMELDNDPEVTYYGYVSKISTSGEARFYWVDLGSGKIIDSNNPQAWFWAMPPEKIMDDEALTAEWYEFVHENVDATFKITGTRGKDDCEYWGGEFPNQCMQNIDIQSIEVVGSDKKMVFG